MQLTFYNCASPTNVVDKSVGTVIGSTTALPQPTGDIDVINPTFIVDVSKVPIPGNANYCYCDTLKRYYFITDIIYATAKTAAIICHIDVLYTYASKIKTTNLNWIRGAGDINEMNDSSYPISDYVTQRHYSLSGWTDNLHNNDSFKQFIFRTVACTPGGWITIDFSDGEELKYGKWIWRIDANGALGAASLLYQREDPTSLAKAVTNMCYIKLTATGLSPQLYQFHGDIAPGATDPNMAYIEYLGTVN